MNDDSEASDAQVDEESDAQGDDESDAQADDGSDADAVEDQSDVHDECDGHSGDESNAQTATTSSSDKVIGKGNKKKEKKPGIIYLSSIPYFMTVKSIRRYFEKYGEIDRLFLQIETRIGSSGRKERHYTEGWIEFKDKDLAKRIAASLNNAMVGGKKRSKSHDCLWNLKYLNGFKWVHLSEQLTYENAVHQQKMRTEISKAKREANFFAEQLEKGENLRKLEEKVLKKGGLWKAYERQLTQKKGVTEKKQNVQSNGEVLGMIFSGDNNRKRKLKD